MALPFLNKKKETGIAGTIIQKRNPDSESELESGEDEAEYSLEDCAHDILDAIQANDASALAGALQEAFEKMESEPHEEGEHTNEPSPHTYDAQNIKAGQE